MPMNKKCHRTTIKVLRKTIFLKFYDLWSIDKWCWLRWKEYEASHTFKRKTVDLSRSYSVCSWTGIEPPHLHSHSLRGETQANDWQSMTSKFIQATMKLATKTCNLFCASYHSRIKSILPCNKSSFCRLHKAVELLTNFCNNFSQPATIWFVARLWGLNVRGKKRNIVFQLLLLQCWNTSCTFFVPVLLYLN